MRLLLLCFAPQVELILFVPVLRALARQFSTITVILVCEEKSKYYFYNIPGVNIISVDLEKEYKGILGIHRLFLELRKLGPFKHALSLKVNILSSLFQIFFFYSRIRFHKIKTDKKNRYGWVRKRFKKRNPVLHLTEFYFRAFGKLGLDVHQTNLENKVWTPWIDLDTSSRVEAQHFLTSKKVDMKKKFIGIAPFSENAYKDWPLNKIEALLKNIINDLDVYVFIFKRLSQTTKKMGEIKVQHPRIIFCLEEINISLEMSLISHMNFFLSMDSIYMHLAALLGVSVISIWGPTHPDLGKAAYKQEYSQVIQIPTSALACRPCSYDAPKKCMRLDHACLEWISVSEVYEKVKNKIQII